MSAAKRYTEEQLRKQVLEAFRIGLAIGEKRAARAEEASFSRPGSFPGRDAKIKAFRSRGRNALITRTREHLTLIRGGAA